MGLLSELIFPHDTEMQQEVSADCTKIQNEVNHQNDLKNDYNSVADTIVDFNTRFLALVGLSTILSFRAADLVDYKDPAESKTSAADKAWADRIGGASASVPMIIELGGAFPGGVKCAMRGTMSIYRCVKSYSVSENIDLLKSTISERIDMVRFRFLGLRAARISALTTQEPDVATELANEIEMEEREVGITEPEANEPTEEGDTAGEVSPRVANAATAAEADAELLRSYDMVTAADLADSGARLGTLGSRVGAILGKAAIALWVGCEIFSAVEEGKVHAQLEKELTNLTKTLTDLQNATTKFRKYMAQMIGIAVEDIEEYNAFIDDIVKLKGKEEFYLQRHWTTSGFPTTNLTALNNLLKSTEEIDTTSNSSHYRTLLEGASDELKVAKACLDEDFALHGSLARAVKSLRDFAQQTQPIPPINEVLQEEWTNWCLAGGQDPYCVLNGQPYHDCDTDTQSKYHELMGYTVELNHYLSQIETTLTPFFKEIGEQNQSPYPKTVKFPSDPKVGNWRDASLSFIGADPKVYAVSAGGRSDSGFGPEPGPGPDSNPGPGPGPG